MTLTNPVHIAFIVIVALIFLGPKRLPEVARSLGNGMREFRETLSGAGLHHDETPGLAPDSQPAPSPQLDADVVAPPPPPPLSQ